MRPSLPHTHCPRHLSLSLSKRERERGREGGREREREREREERLEPSSPYFIEMFGLLESAVRRDVLL
jgi:hypothetical protein